MSSGIVRIANRGLTNQIDGEVMATQLMSDDAEEVQCFGMIGLRGQDLAVKRLGVTEPSGLMVLESEVEGLLDGNRGHRGHRAKKEDIGCAHNAIHRGHGGKDETMLPQKGPLRRSRAASLWIQR